MVSQKPFSFSLVSKNHYVKSQPDGVTVTRTGKPSEIIKMNLDSDPLYGSYVRVFLTTKNANKPLMSGLVDVAYRLVSLRQAVSI